jgi:SAM-dependent methyltransferase
MTNHQQEETRAAWDKVAAGYDEFVTPTNFGLGAEALRRAGLRPGMRLLDVAAGIGVMLFPDLPRGLREMARVTKPGGRVLVVALGAPMKIEFFNFFIRAVQAAVPGFTGPPMDPVPLPFQLQDPEKLRREMVKAGLRDVRVEETSEEMKYQSGKQFWDWGDEQQPDRRHDPRRAEFEQRAARCDPAGDGRLDLRARRGERHGYSDQPDQHRHRNEVKALLVQRSSRSPFDLIVIFFHLPIYNCSIRGSR